MKLKTIFLNLNHTVLLLLSQPASQISEPVHTALHLAFSLDYVPIRYTNDNRRYR